MITIPTHEPYARGVRTPSPLKSRRPFTTAVTAREQQQAVNSLYINAPTCFAPEELDSSPLSKNFKVQIPFQPKYLRSKSPIRQPRDRITLESTSFSPPKTHSAFLVVNGKNNQRQSTYHHKLSVRIPSSNSGMSPTGSAYVRKLKLTPVTPIEVVYGTGIRDDIYSKIPTRNILTSQVNKKRRNTGKDEMLCIGTPIKG
jgi:hypothetical protein